MRSDIRPAHILCIDDEPDLLDTLRKVLTRAGHRVSVAQSGEEGVEIMARIAPDLVITDLMMPGLDGMGVLDRSRQLHPDVPVILVTAFATLETAIDAIRRGAYDYVPKPFTREQFLVVVDRALALHRLQDENIRLKRQIENESDNAGIIGASPAMRIVLDMVRRVAPTDLGVLITGESGTGKEVVARALHRLSSRRDRAFVPVDCGAIPHNLMESELFGHERGAFTGATGARAGLVEAADGGTFFLDEIGELEHGVQVKLLRLLQEGEYRRVGGNNMRSASLRVVAATNRDLESAVRTGAFREDLFHRVNVVRLELPPLRERTDDVPLLMRHFVGQLSAEAHRGEMRISPEVLEAMQRHAWPGNVRELMNCCRYIVGLAEGPVVRLTDLPPALRVEGVPSARQPVASRSEPDVMDGDPPTVRFDLPYKQAKRVWLERFERTYILRLLEHHGGNISQAARNAGIDRKSIQRLMKRNDMAVGDEVTDDDDSLSDD